MAAAPGIDDNLALLYAVASSECELVAVGSIKAMRPRPILASPGNSLVPGAQEDRAYELQDGT
jgi:hypothetical protein